MERFCNKCGSLVSGDGVFCPNCGERLDSAVDLGKPASQVQDVMPSGASAGASAGASGASATGSAGSNTPASSGVYGSANPNGTYGTANSTGNMGTMPSYSQPIQPINTQPEMTVGQWVLTLFLSGLGIIGLILLFVWAFGNDTPTSKRNYARAMLIWQAISIGLIVIFYIGFFLCVGAAAGGLEGFFEEMENMDYYAAINNFFIR